MRVRAIIIAVRYSYMGILDSITGAAGGFDINELATRVGFTPEQVQQVIAALGQQQAQPGDTAEGTANQTGLPLDKIQALLAQIGGEGALGKLGGVLGGLGR